MKYCIRIFTILHISILSFNAFSQSIALSKPSIEFQDNIFRIYYDIHNTDKEDRFDITLHIQDSLGKQIVANALTGDIGENVLGGDGKTISWDLTLDSVYMETTLYFKVKAKQLVTPERQAENKQPGVEIKTNPANIYEELNYSREKAIKHSLLFPGSGLTIINKGKPHWLRGAAGYGLLGTSVYLKYNSQQVYQEYLVAETVQAKNELYSEVQKLNTNSNTLLFCAAGVWVVDFIWTLTSTKHTTIAGLGDQFRISSGYNYMAAAPLLSLQINF